MIYLLCVFAQCSFRSGCFHNYKNGARQVNFFDHCKAAPYLGRRLRLAPILYKYGYFRFYDIKFIFKRKYFLSFSWFYKTKYLVKLCVSNEKLVIIIEKLCSHEYFPGKYSIGFFLNAHRKVILLRNYKNTEKMCHILTSTSRLLTIN